MADDQQKGKKKRKKKRKVTADIVAETQEEESPSPEPSQETLPEEEIDPTGIELSWRAHLLIYAVVAAVVLGLFFTYVNVMHKKSVEYYQSASDVLARAAVLEEKREDPEQKKTAEEIEEQLVELQKRTVLVAHVINESIANDRNFKKDEQVEGSKALKEQVEKVDEMLKARIGEVTHWPGIQKMWEKYEQKRDQLLLRIDDFLKEPISGRNYLYKEAIEEYLPRAERVIQLWDLEEIYKVAIAELLESVRFERTNLDALLALAQSYLKQGWEDQALETYMRVIWVDRKGGKYYEQAFKDIDSLVERESPYRDAYFYKAVGLCILDRLTEASQALEKYLALGDRSIWVEEAKKLKTWTDTGNRKRIKDYLYDDLWVHGRTTF